MPAFYRDPHPTQFGKPFFLTLKGPVWAGPDPQFVERGVMAPDIPNVVHNRHPEPEAAAWNYSDEVLRWLFHGQ